MAGLLLFTPGLALPTVLAVSVSSGRFTTCSLLLEELSQAREFPPVVTDSSAQHSECRVLCPQQHSENQTTSRRRGWTEETSKFWCWRCPFRTAENEKGSAGPRGAPPHTLWASFGCGWGLAHPGYRTRVCGCAADGEGWVPRKKRQDARASASPSGRSFWPTALPQQGVGKYVLFWH